MKKARNTILFVFAIFLSLSLGFFCGRTSHKESSVITNSENSTDSLHSTATNTEPTSPSFGKVNINTASIDELQMLPNIGEVLAERIIDYRNEFGPFTSIRDLEAVSGIGKKRIEGIEQYATVGG